MKTDLNPFIKKLQQFPAMTDEERKEHWEEMKPLLIKRLHDMKVEIEFNALWEKIKNND